MPNAWDARNARMLASQGFPAIEKVGISRNVVIQSAPKRGAGLPIHHRSGALVFRGRARQDLLWPLAEFEKKNLQKALDSLLQKHRQPPYIRPQLELGRRINGQSKELFGIRPRLDKPENKLKLPVAKATYVKTSALWNVYRQRAELKWHRYDPAPQVASLKNY